jgi:hypothetical protein
MDPVTRPGPGRLGRHVSLGGLLLLALSVTVTFLLRTVFEYDGDEYLIDLNMYQWPHERSASRCSASASVPAGRGG